MKVSSNKFTCKVTANNSIERVTHPIWKKEKENKNEICILLLFFSIRFSQLECI